MVDDERAMVEQLVDNMIRAGIIVPAKSREAVITAILSGVYGEVTDLLAGIDEAALPKPEKRIPRFGLE